MRNNNSDGLMLFLNSMMGKTKAKR